ncbi:transcriptional repressor smtB [Firmicutes bacterium CAG:582]|nr:transcriptional repressor smtB [Firmicutes bacterium CAG:582]
MKTAEVCDCNVIHENVVEDVKSKMLDNEFITEISTFFKILGDNTRVKILFALDHNEMCVCDIANVLNMTKSSISHQLSYLKDLNIVKSRKSGKEVYYSLDDEHVKEVFEVVISHIEHKRSML